MDAEDVIYMVLYDGAHKSSVLCATTNESKAIEEANKHQGFRVEKWENGSVINSRFYDGGTSGRSERAHRDTGHRLADETGQQRREA